MTRKEILQVANLPDSGRVTNVLEELEAPGFIGMYLPFGKKKKGKVFRLSDEYSAFYLKFIENHRFPDQSGWTGIANSQSFKIWSGYAFEGVCLKHLKEIKSALGIAGIRALASSFVKKSNEQEPGTQIDLVIDRADHFINLVETKFYSTPYAISKEYAQNLREKVRIFRDSTNTRKQISLVFISCFGLHQNQYSMGLIDADFSIDILFK